MKAEHHIQGEEWRGGGHQQHTEDTANCSTCHMKSGSQGHLHNQTKSLKCPFLLLPGKH